MYNLVLRHYNWNHFIEKLIEKYRLRNSNCKGNNDFLELRNPLRKFSYHDINQYHSPYGS